MGNLKDEAQAYEPQQVQVISEIEVVRTDLDVKEDTGVDSNGKEFTYKFVIIDGNKYRVPNSVLEQLKTILTAKPDLKTFTVKKAGSGMSTKYTVVQLD